MTSIVALRVTVALPSLTVTTGSSLTRTRSSRGREPGRARLSCRDRGGQGKGGVSEGLENAMEKVTDLGDEREKGRHGQRAALGDLWEQHR